MSRKAEIPERLPRTDGNSINQSRCGRYRAITHHLCDPQLCHRVLPKPIQHTSNVMLTSMQHMSRSGPKKERWSALRSEKCASPAGSAGQGRANLPTTELKSFAVTMSDLRYQSPDPVKCRKTRHCITRCPYIRLHWMDRFATFPFLRALFNRRSHFLLARLQAVLILLATALANSP